MDQSMIIRINRLKYETILKNYHKWCKMRTEIDYKPRLQTNKKTLKKKSELNCIDKAKLWNMFDKDSDSITGKKPATLECVYETPKESNLCNV